MRRIEEISLLLSGALIGFSLLPLENQISNHLVLLGTLFIILFLVGIGLLRWALIFLMRATRAINKKTRKVAIIYPYEVDNDNSSWIGVSFRQIRHVLKKGKILFSEIKNLNDFEKFPIVVNPYGGVYPEEDAFSLKTLESIFLYVKNGGIFVNIADIPFYYAYDKNLNRRIDTTPLIGSLSLTRSFFDTLLSKKLQVFVLGLVDKKYLEQNIARVISLSDNAINYHSEAFSINFEGVKNNYSPYLAIPFGKGYFVFSTLAIRKTDISRILEIIKRSLELID